MRSETEVLKEIDRVFEKLVSEKEQIWIYHYTGYLRALRWLVK
jgi:hypothetical protein